MENNVANKLRNCNKGHVLYSTLFGDCVLDSIIGGVINVKYGTNQENSGAFYADGKYTKGGEVVLFPSREQRDWSKFFIPFKPGDFVEGDDFYTVISSSNNDFCSFYFKLKKSDLSIEKVTGDVLSLKYPNDLSIIRDGYVKSKITSEIKKSGYKLTSDYNLEKNLIEPRGTVGDCFQLGGVAYIISEVKSDVYICNLLKYSDQENPEQFQYKINIVDSTCKFFKATPIRFNIGQVIVSKKTEKRHVIKNFEKNTYITNYGLRFTTDQEDLFTEADPMFDVTTLKPFDKVLIRTSNSDIWECDIFSSYNPYCSNPFHCIGTWAEQCIPFNEDTKHLIGKVDEPNKFYVTWEKE